MPTRQNGVENRDRPISKAVDEVPEETPCDDTCKPELFSPSPQDLGDCSMPENASQDVPEIPLGAPKVLCDLFNSCQDTNRLRSLRRT